MSHNIGQMFYVGERPWHELGRHFKQPLRLDEALKAGGLDYAVSQKPLTVKEEPLSGVAQRVAVVREDRCPGETGRVLGVVHPQFKLLQNREGGELFDSLFGNGSAVYHTGGYLKQGEVVWLQAKLPEPIVVAGHDQLDVFLLFSNSHDGSYPIDIRISTVRVVCNNTLNQALNDKTEGHVFRRGHSGRLELVKDAAVKFFAVVLATQLEVQERMNRMAQTACDAQAFAAFLDRLLPIPTKPATASTNPSVSSAYETRCIKIEAARQEVIGVNDNGYRDPSAPNAWHPAAEKTWWGALNSVTAWVDHLQKFDGHRFAHKMFGSGADLKSKAFKVATEALRPD
jgi:phage/plasmid-like protein (TIGR03299 family)